MIEPITIGTLVGVVCLVVYEVVKLIRKGTYRSSCMVKSKDEK